MSLWHWDFKLEPSDFQLLSFKRPASEMQHGSKGPAAISRYREIRPRYTSFTPNFGRAADPAVQAGVARVRVACGCARISHAATLRLRNGFGCGASSRRPNNQALKLEAGIGLRVACGRASAWRAAGSRLRVATAHCQPASAQARRASGTTRCMHTFGGRCSTMNP
jgi:hypothetical protein